ncbi:MAG TPA: ABC transporter ATP-binding protein [Bryobacteraceae bacterium]|nr:ABC transporter ATP-binding protein [Bryobacteraceae bacterium]
MTSAILTQRLQKHFGRTDVLAGLDLDVPPGSIYGLLGPNGAGKTTTIKLIMNILQPSGGRSEALGMDSRRLSPAEFARIGYVSENQEMPNWMTVGYFLEYLSGFYPAWDAALATDLMRKFELPPDRRLGHLSRGMRMKAALASSLAYRPELIVLDEPFTGLDALVRDELIEGLLAQADGATIFISSHDLAEIESFASHIGYLDHRRLQFSEELETLRDRFREISLTFEAPPALPREWPAKWLEPETAGHVVRFVDTQFSEAGTAAEARRLFPDFREMEATGLPLRSIFVTLAKASRRAGGEA